MEAEAVGLLSFALYVAQRVASAAHYKNGQARSIAGLQCLLIVLDEAMDVVADSIGCSLTVEDDRVDGLCIVWMAC